MRFFKIFVRDTHIYWYYCYFHHSLPTHSRGGAPEKRQVILVDSRFDSLFVNRRSKYKR